MCTLGRTREDGRAGRDYYSHPFLFGPLSPYRKSHSKYLHSEGHLALIIGLSELFSSLVRTQHPGHSLYLGEFYFQHWPSKEICCLVRKTPRILFACKESENKKEKKTKKQNKQPIFLLSEKSWDRTGLDTPVVAGGKKKEKRKKKKKLRDRTGLVFCFCFLFCLQPQASSL